jgi:serine/threonine-protein kinase
MAGFRPQFRDRVGTTLAEKYALKHLLGVGGMAAVFEAENTWTGRRVAIKLLTADLDDDDEKATRFMQEARAATRVEHPNIVQILDMGRDDDDGSLFIVEEYLTGQDLRSLLDGRSKLPLRSALEIMIPVMDALRAAHARGVVHRDIKPANIFLAQLPTGEIVPKVIDFGVVKMSSSDGITKTGTTIGTPEYMSPEQAHGDKTIDQQTDIWSSAVVLWEMLAGRCPYENENYHALLVKIIWEATPRIDSVIRDLPAGFADVLHKALERDRAARYPDMRAFIDAVLAVSSLQREPWMQALAGAYAPKRSLPRPNEVTGFISVPSRPPPPMASSPADVEPTTAMYAPPNAKTIEIDTSDLTSATTGPKSAPAVATLDPSRPTPTPPPATRSSPRVTKRGLIISLALGLAGAIGAALALRTSTGPVETPRTVHPTTAAPTPIVPVPSGPATPTPRTATANAHPATRPDSPRAPANPRTPEPAASATPARAEAPAPATRGAHEDEAPDEVAPAPSPPHASSPARRNARRNPRTRHHNTVRPTAHHTRNGAPILSVP